MENQSVTDEYSTKLSGNVTVLCEAHGLQQACWLLASGPSVEDKLVALVVSYLYFLM